MLCLAQISTSLLAQIEFFFIPNAIAVRYFVFCENFVDQIKVKVCTFSKTWPRLNEVDTTRVGLFGNILDNVLKHIRNAKIGLNLRMSNLERILSNWIVELSKFYLNVNICQVQCMDIITESCSINTTVVVCCLQTLLNDST